MSIDFQEEQWYGRFNDNNEMYSALDPAQEAACENSMPAEWWESASEEEKAAHIAEQNKLMRDIRRDDDPNHTDSRTESCIKHDEWCDKNLK